MGMGVLSDYEQEQLKVVSLVCMLVPLTWYYSTAMFCQAIPELLKNIAKGEEFVKNS